MLLKERTKDTSGSTETHTKTEKRQKRLYSRRRKRDLVTEGRCCLSNPRSPDTACPKGLRMPCVLRGTETEMTGRSQKAASKAPQKRGRLQETGRRWAFRTPRGETDDGGKPLPPNSRVLTHTCPRVLTCRPRVFPSRQSRSPTTQSPRSGTGL